MLHNYIKIAYRSLLNKKVYAGINIFGLSIGIACCLFIFQYVAYEYSFDRFNANYSQIYRVIKATAQVGDQPAPEATVGWAMGPALAQELPEIEYIVRLHPEENNAFITNPSQPDRVFEEERAYYVDSSFFQVFSYPILLGNYKQPLAKPGTVMLSESAAKKYFGKENPIGQVLEVRGWIDNTYRVEGIFEDVPAHSHLQFDVLFPMVDLLTKSRFSEPSTGWGWTNFITYVQLNENADLVAVDEKFTEILKRNREAEWRQSNLTGYAYAQPLSDVYLNEKIPVTHLATGGSYRAVYFFTIIGLITLLIALVNYINLTTARSLDRAREVGVRKAVGAKRGELITQFLSESILTIFISFTFALVLVESFRPIINQLAGNNVNDALWVTPYFMWSFLSLLGITTLFAGLYPAFILSSFKCEAVLKGHRSKTQKGIGLRKALVVFQFTSSIVLLVGTTVVYTQLDYMQNMDLGIDIEQVLTVKGPRELSEGTERLAAIESFRQEIGRLPTVLQSATSGALPGQGYNLSISSVQKVSTDPFSNVPGAIAWVDTNFIDLYGLELIAGEGFKDISIAAGDQEPYPIIANETAIYSLGFESPAQAIEQKINLAGGNLCYIVGVFKDFNWSSAHHKRENAFFMLGGGLRNISIKIDTKNLSKTLTSIRGIYQKQFPGNPFSYAFADEAFDTQYQNDQRFAKLFGVFAVLTIFISCLGLFGLVVFTAKQRTKEIGIRKVLGATVTNIVALLSQEFLKLVLLGFLISIPIGWYIMKKWLAGFAYRIEMGMWTFLIAGAFAFLIAMATVSWQSLRAAVANPVDSLRDE